MAFVDVMRLACVAGSDLARASNRPRYGEFVDVADMHLGEFRTQVTRLSAGADLDMLMKCGGVERSLAWCIERLRRGPSLDRGWGELITPLKNTAERVNALADTASRDYYAARVGEVASVVKAAVGQVPAEDLARHPDTFVQRRLSAQSAVLERMRSSGGFAAATIRDDVDRRLAIPYFTIDLELLRKSTAG